jgi:hypothetical protein
MPVVITRVCSSCKLEVHVKWVHVATAAFCRTTMRNFPQAPASTLRLVRTVALRMHRSNSSLRNGAADSSPSAVLMKTSWFCKDSGIHCTVICRSWHNAVTSVHMLRQSGEIANCSHILDAPGSDET